MSIYVSEFLACTSLSVKTQHYLSHYPFCFDWLNFKHLSQMDGRVYVFFKTEALCQQFLSQAEQEGFTFQDGAKPTERHTSDIIAVNNDFTINYVGSVGHVAFGSNVKRIGEENLIRIDYEDYIR